LGRDEKHPCFSKDVALFCLVGFEPFTALSIGSQY